jgi:hypothetical protein
MMFFLMVRGEFEEFWRSEKSIVDEIRFVASKQCEEVYEFDHVEVLAPFPSIVLVHGSYSCRTEAVVYTFWIEGLGPIVRYCMGGPDHRGAGRFHYHCMRNAADIRQNLPFAESRPDMDGLTAKQIWEQICIEGKITHTDLFFEPEHLCK